MFRDIYKEYKCKRTQKNKNHSLKIQGESQDTNELLLTRLDVYNYREKRQIYKQTERGKRKYSLVLKIKKLNESCKLNL